MGKLPNVTAEELSELVDRACDLSGAIPGVNGRIEKGYADPINGPLGLASIFLSLSRSAADLAATLLSKGALDEMRRTTEAAIRARAKP